MCAYTQGDGQNGSDAKVHKIYYPGQQFTKGTDENSYYFPCNMRNVRFVPGSTDVRADGKPISSIVYRNKIGNEVSMDLTMYWTLNQDSNVLKSTTIPLFNKYQAASSDPEVRNANFSTNGWSKGFLGENVIPILESTADDAIRSRGDEVWKDSSQKAAIATQIATNFMTNLKAATGSTQNVICGSGESSGWTDPDNPGKGTFNCGNVRVVVTDIVPTNKDLMTAQAREAQAATDKTANAAELDAAKQKYGADAGKVLGQLDVIAACKAAGMTICSTDGNGGITVGTGK